MTVAGAFKLRPKDRPNRANRVDSREYLRVRDGADNHGQVAVLQRTYAVAAKPRVCGATVISANIRDARLGWAKRGNERLKRIKQAAVAARDVVADAADVISAGVRRAGRLKDERLGATQVLKDLHHARARLARAKDFLADARAEIRVGLVRHALHAQAEKVERGEVEKKVRRRRQSCLQASVGEQRIAKRQRVRGAGQQPVEDRRNAAKPAVRQDSF